MQVQQALSVIFGLQNYHICVLSLANSSVSLRTTAQAHTHSLTWNVAAS